MVLLFQCYYFLIKVCIKPQDASCYFLFFFLQSTVDLQCCANFRYTAKWFIYIYVCVYKYIYTCMLSCFSHVWLFTTPQTVAHQAPLSMGFTHTCTHAHTHTHTHMHTFVFQMLFHCRLLQDIEYSFLCSSVKVKVKVKSLSRVRLFVTPWTVAYRVPPSMEFFRQECWSGLPFPSPGDLPDPGIEPGSPALQADALSSEPPGTCSAVGPCYLSILYMVVLVCLGTQSCPIPCTLWTVARQAPLSMDFSRQEYQSGLPFPSPGDLRNPGIEPVSSASPTLQADSLPDEPSGKQAWVSVNPNILIYPSPPRYATFISVIVIL